MLTRLFMQTLLKRVRNEQRHHVIQWWIMIKPSRSVSCEQFCIECTNETLESVFGPPEPLDTHPTPNSGIIFSHAIPHRRSLELTNDYHINGLMLLDINVATLHCLVKSNSTALSAIF